VTRYYVTSGFFHFLLLAFLLWSPWVKRQPPIFMIEGFDYLGQGGGGGGGGIKKENLGQVVPLPPKMQVPSKPAPVQPAKEAEKPWAVKKAKEEKEIKKEAEHAVPVSIGEKTQQEKSNIVRIGKTGEEGDTNYVGLGEGKGPGIGIGVGEGAGGGGGFGYGSYLAIMRRKIWSEWTQSAVYGTGLDCVIGLTVLKDGEVKEIKIEKTSNNAFYDNVAMRAVRNASPLPPLPTGFQATEQRFRIKFVLVD